MDYNEIRDPRCSIESALSYLTDNGNLLLKPGNISTKTGLLRDHPKIRKIILRIHRLNVILEELGKAVKKTEIEIQDVEKMLFLLLEVTTEHYDFLPEVVRSHYEEQLFINQQNLVCLVGLSEDYQDDIHDIMQNRIESEQEIMELL